MLIKSLVLILAVDCVLSARLPSAARHSDDQDDDDDNDVQESQLFQQAGPQQQQQQPQPQFNSTPTANYTNFVDLVPSVYRFYWNLTAGASNSSKLVGELHCRTHGWLAFGLSPDGDMDESDIIVAWVRNGSANFTVSQQIRNLFLTPIFNVFCFGLGSLHHANRDTHRRSPRLEAARLQTNRLV